MKSNSQYCKKPLISKREQNYIIDDELTEESIFFEQTTQSFSEISELDSKQQFEIKHCEYNKSEQVFKQKQQFKQKQKDKEIVFYEDITQYIQQFKPKYIELDVKLKPFIPDYTPAVNQIESGISIPRPDGKFDNYGLHDVREILLGQHVDRDQTMVEDKLKYALKKQRQNIQKQEQQKEKNQQRPKAEENLPESLKDLFKIISLYEPKNIDIEEYLKPFIPDYIPQVLDPDPMLKIPRPDGKEDNLGLTVLDERLVNGVYMQCN